MRILVLSDIHANWPALAAIREEFDVCLFLGDLVDYGVEPGPCIDWVRRNARYAIRGNHDHGAAQRIFVQGIGGFRYLTGVTRPLTITRLNADERQYLGGLPTSLWLTLNGKRYLLVHATPRDPLDEFAPPDSDAWRRRVENIDADYVLVGHSHAQFLYQFGKTTVLNPGSVGLPRDGDPRPAYAVITDRGPELKRIEYPVERTLAALAAAPLPEPARLALTEVLQTGRLERKLGNGNGNGNGSGSGNGGLGLNGNGALLSDHKVRHG
jgi:putative phosphoesterase